MKKLFILGALVTGALFVNSNVNAQTTGDAPVAVVSILNSTSNGHIVFDASGSYDSDGQIVDIEWIGYYQNSLGHGDRFVDKQGYLNFVKVTDNDGNEVTIVVPRP